VGCARWTGVRLKDVLEAAGPKPSAIYTAHYGADPHLSGDPEKQALSRGVRLEKAMEPHTLVAFAINGEPLPAVHGAPVRLLVPGWSGSASQKWLTRIQLRDVEHDGQGMKGTSYRVPVVPIVPGTDHKGEVFRILESMPVKSLITSPTDGTRPPAGTRELEVRGHAWAGDLTVQDVFVSLDFGQTWQQTELNAPANRYAWQRWSTTAALPSEGYYEIWARAVDSEGRSQPFTAPNWNPGGYGGNAYHRVAILVEA
jgi:DMSO/TMAO reductase YedYZ molybdopterin-dependent catalytic subunit